jgi:hypothetical protein
VRSSQDSFVGNNIKERIQRENKRGRRRERCFVANDMMEGRQGKGLAEFESPKASRIYF